MIYISLVAIIFFTDCVEWYFLPKTEIKVFLKKMDIRGFGWRPSIYINVYMNYSQNVNSFSCSTFRHSLLLLKQGISDIFYTIFFTCSL